MDQKVKVKPRNVTISARVYRAAEGRWVDLGIVARTQSSRTFRLQEVIRRWLQFLRKTEKNG